MDTFKILQTLSETPGPSGFEQPVADAIREIWEPYVDEFDSDLVGSLVGVKKGEGEAPRGNLLLAAHMDEIGLIVSQIDEHNGQGFIRVERLGGVDNRHLYGQLVTVHGKRDLSGVLGALPSPMLPEKKRDKAFDYEALVVDTGLPIDELKTLVDIGDPISFRQPLHKLQGKRVAGKALDNRASVTAVTACLDYLTQRKHTWDVTAVATSQEETRLLGAYTSAHSRRPDIAIAIDVTFGKGPGASGPGTFELGSGPVLEIGPNVHPGMYKALQDAAEALEMSVSVGTHSRASGTDAYGLQVARSGLPTGLVSIPLRYMHTMVESIDLVDVERVGRLLGEFAARLDDKFLENLTAGMMDDDKDKNSNGNDDNDDNDNSD